jgi:hypothetical protein
MALRNENSCEEEEEPDTPAWASGEGPAMVARFCFFFIRSSLRSTGLDRGDSFLKEAGSVFSSFCCAKRCDKSLSMRRWTSLVI